MKKSHYIIMCALLSFISAWAQEGPVIQKFIFDDSAIINGMSDNGQYACANSFDAEDALIQKGARLIEIDTEKVTDLTANHGTFASMGTTDVTNDGSIVVGELNHKPAYWSKATGKWTQLPCEDSEYYGEVKAITPDGKYAVGRQSIDEDGFYSLPAMWDMTTGKLMETPGVPEYDMTGKSQDQNWFNQISADGNLILGCISYSYISNQFYYIYDVKNETYTPIGFTESNKRFTPVVDGILFINSATFSNNAEWVTGRAYMYKAIEGNQFGNQYETSYTYNVKSGAFELYDTSFDHDLVASAIDSQGNAMAATPSGTPIREWSVRNGAYWFPFSQILKQQYGYDFYAKTLFDNTGTPMFLSDDNKRATVMVDPYSSYVVTLPTTFSEACKGVDLLGSYIVYPREGATISRLKEITITFDHDIQIVGAKNCVEIRNAAGETVYSSIGFTANGKKATITYRNASLDEGEKYTLHIPAGAVALAMDKAMINKAIDIAYNGRANTPVKLTNIYPSEESAIAKIDNNTNPIVLTFDVPVFLPDSAIAYLYNEAEVEPVATLLMAYSGSVVAVYPNTTQYLFKDNNYRVEVMPGSVTDVAGNGANEKIVIKYRGSYEREIVYDDNSLLIENFNTVGVANCLPWDADRLQPNATAKAIGFDRHDYGWAIVWDDNDSNIAASSHSMYEPAGKSNDWLIMPQIYIPDEKCALTFLSQSFLTGYKDYLKVYIWANEEVITMPSDELVARFAQEGDLVYNELQSPGSDDNTLAGDWTENYLSLADYAGKNIYIAFVNDNEAQSAVFIDDVMVSHNKPFRVAFTNETSVVARESILIAGALSIDSDTDVYESISLTLTDNEGNEIETISENGLSLKKGDVYKFAFANALPLETGIVNKFTLTVVCNDNHYDIDGKITNLAFNPVKRVVLEEISGMGCQNCPLGFLSIDKIHELYGDLFIPICIRTFQDPLGAGLTDYTDFLGLSSAPSGVINRKSMCFPAVSYNNDYYFSNTQLPVASDKLWLDVVGDELQIPTEADINVGEMTVDTKTNEIVIPCTVKYALTSDNCNLNLFTVVMEDYVSSMQKNGFSSLALESLGEWGKGGIYGQSLVMDYKLLDVCRSYEGLTFNGTGGYLPQEIVAGEEYTAEVRTKVPATLGSFTNCKVVVMLIDANTGAYINAAMSNTFTSINNISNNANATVTTADGKIVVTTTDNARIEAYTANGMLIGTAYGNGQASIDAPAGVAVVRVITGNDATVTKVLVK